MEKPSAAWQTATLRFSARRSFSCIRREMRLVLALSKQVLPSSGSGRLSEHMVPYIQFAAGFLHRSNSFSKVQKVRAGSTPSGIIR